MAFPLSPRQASTILSWNTKYHADSTEFCPISPHQDILAVGTYELEEHEPKNTPAPVSDAPKETDTDNATSDDCDQEVGGQIPGDAVPTSEIVDTTAVFSTRLGCLYLHWFDGTTAEQIQTLDMFGILDMKWSCQRVCDLIILAVATAAGEVLLYTLREGESTPKLELLCRAVLDDGNSLALSLDWSNRKIDSDSPLLAVSDSKGYVNIFEFRTSDLVLTHRAQCHDFEAWITAINYWSPWIIYSGGDDSVLRGYDLRCGLSSATFTNRKHEAGVTSLHSNEHREHLLVSGSYDEVVRVWDARAMRGERRSRAVGGGVWRLKWEPSGGARLLAACMYGHFTVLEDCEEQLEPLVRYEKHGSIAYGADWSWKGTTIVAASFYDNLVSLWNF